MKDNPKPAKGGRYVLDEVTNALVQAVVVAPIVAMLTPPADTEEPADADTSDETPAAGAPRRTRTQKG